jgi:hypothetical protein
MLLGYLNTHLLKYIIGVMVKRKLLLCKYKLQFSQFQINI